MDERFGIPPSQGDLDHYITMCPNPNCKVKPITATDTPNPNQTTYCTCRAELKWREYIEGFLSPLKQRHLSVYIFVCLEPYTTCSRKTAKKDLFPPTCDGHNKIMKVMYKPA